jgi:hypothetical protein
MKTDLSFTEDGMFTRFLPNSPAGETAWAELAKNSDGSGAFLTVHAAGIVRQLRAAGYAVSRRRVSGTGVLTAGDVKLLESLNA